MRLKDAIRIASKLATGLEGQDAAAVVSLVRLAKRIERLQNPLRQVADVICPRDPAHLNQQSLFGDDGGD